MKSLLQDCVTLTVGTAPVLNLFLKTLYGISYCFTVDTFQGSCEKKNIELVIQFPPKHCNVYADKGKIEQVLYNLLDNAIKFSNPGSKIIIKLYNKGEKQYCSVKDFGMGIPQDSIDKIWQRFYKTDLSVVVTKQAPESDLPS